MNFNTISSGFGTRFKEILNKYNIKQSKFSKDTGTHPGLVSRYVNGESPSGDFILKAVAYFPKDIQFLFFGSGDHLMEPDSFYNKKPEDIIMEIEKKLSDLKQVLSQN